MSDDDQFAQMRRLEREHAEAGFWIYAREKKPAGYVPAWLRDSQPPTGGATIPAK